MVQVVVQRFHGECPSLEICLPLLETRAVSALRWLTEQSRARQRYDSGTAWKGSHTLIDSKLCTVGRTLPSPNVKVQWTRFVRRGPPRVFGHTSLHNGVEGGVSIFLSETVQLLFSVAESGTVAALACPSPQVDGSPVCFLNTPALDLSTSTCMRIWMSTRLLFTLEQPGDTYALPSKSGAVAVLQ